MLSDTRRVCLSAVLFIAAASAASAQVVAPYSETFDGGAVPAGWTLTATSTTVVWDVDALPGPLVGAGPNGPTFGGSTGSLNYNDDTDFDDAGLTNSGNALSPVIDVSGLGGTIFLSFRCNHETEFGTFYDRKLIDVINPATGLPIVGGSYQVATSQPAPLTCSPMGTYHLHTINISAVVGALTTIQIRFRFDTWDGIANSGDGWFVDNLSVTCGDAIPPTVPTLLLPADASTVPSPPGVTLDWTNATDTTACGVGTVASYVVEVDTTNPPVTPFTFSASPAASTATTAVLPAGTYFWWVRAVDASGNTSANSAVFSFIVEPPLAPLAADTLYVNESNQGAQSGSPGYVDPIVDENPVMSAIYRDPNTVDSALSLRYQVTDDPTFAFVLYDSGTVVLAPPLAKDARTQDLPSGVALDRDTVYYWRILFTDTGTLSGPWSAAQSFRTGDDWEFGVRKGSSNHSKKCFVATASFEGEVAEVRSLMGFRSGVVERAGVGRVFSRAYAACGSGVARQVGATGARRAAVRHALAPLASFAQRPATVGVLACLLGLCLLVLARRRM